MTSGIGFIDKTSKDNPVAIAVFVNAQTLELLVGIRDVPQQFWKSGLWNKVFILYLGIFIATPSTLPSGSVTAVSQYWTTDNTSIVKI